jgi:hypothetical protein
MYSSRKIFTFFFSLILFLAQEKNQKNMHLKRIAKSSLRFGKKNNSAPDFDHRKYCFWIVKPAQQNGGQADFSSVPPLRSDFRRNSFNVRKTKTFNANNLRPFKRY